MSTDTCPACGASIQFKSRFSKTTVCTFCQSFLVKEEKGLVFSGKMAELASDMSIFQVGTKGNFDNNHFEVIGQIKINWREGYWNEWYVLEEKGTEAWIAEAMGNYNYIHEVELPPGLDNPQRYDLNSTIMLNDIYFIVSDIKPFVVAGCVGELPFEIKAGIEGISFDLRSEGDECAYLEYSDEAYRLFMGKRVEFEDLNLSNIRVPNGW